ncbi:hypothetical protein tinsulaeT_37060 [Thalassotalea insulae]|uniref:Uncharacterized protein n=2 Tax=Thalassotalea insulae TaxID=2056778 RepID=A0ABQ6GWP6_9GAMM|nr:hypothetical protein tinsulaeT_37060 [Thalassotalea insulae]
MFGHLFDEQVHAKRAARAKRKEAGDAFGNESFGLSGLFGESNENKESKQKKGARFQLGFSVASGNKLRLEAKLSFESELNGQADSEDKNNSRGSKSKVHYSFNDEGELQAKQIDTHEHEGDTIKHTRDLKNGSSSREMSRDKPSTAGVFSFSESHSAGTKTTTINFGKDKQFGSAAELHKAMAAATKESQQKFDSHASSHRSDSSKHSSTQQHNNPKQTSSQAHSASTDHNEHK